LLPGESESAPLAHDEAPWSIATSSKNLGLMDVHPIAAAGFGSAADAYERGRPEYPSAAIHWLARRVGLRAGVTVVDLAAGTGKLSRPLAATGARVIAVEPVEAMRRAIGPGVETVEGTAEAIQLPDGSAGVVTVGQAFHWFDGDAALAEIHRVLRAAGALALLWNARRMEDRIHATIEDLINPHCERIPRHRTQAWRGAFARTELFGPLEEMQFPHEQTLDAEGLAAQLGSISAIAALPEDERSRILERIRSLAGTGQVTLRYICEVHVAERVSDPAVRR
jgi:SAM-dependent methyltransferase